MEGVAGRCVREDVSVCLERRFSFFHNPWPVALWGRAARTPSSPTHVSFWMRRECVCVICVDACDATVAGCPGWDSPTAGTISIHPTWPRSRPHAPHARPAPISLGCATVMHSLDGPPVPVSTRAHPVGRFQPSIPSSSHVTFSLSLSSLFPSSSCPCPS